MKPSTNASISSTVVGPRGAKQGVVEFGERRGGGGREELTPEALLNRLTAGR